jgi:glycosyltransferase involved in cell wall biosynthesis
MARARHKKALGLQLNEPGSADLLELERMRILVVSAMFPPNVLGGAEISAFNLSSWLLKQGHEIGVLTAAKSREEEKFGELVDGMRIWSIYMPRPYPIYKQGRVDETYLKPLWHLQDHLDPRNGRIVGRVLDEFKPEFCNVHYLTGIGHNVLQEFAKRDLPMMYVMPDLALSCLRLTMFVDGKTCETQCGVCKLSAGVKRRGILSMRRIGFCSPSRANLERNAEFQPLKQFPTAHILNANKYPTPTVQRVESETVRFVYAGRLHEAKGIDCLLEAAEGLVDRWPFTFTIVGGGGHEPALRKRFGHHPWISFTGHVPLQEAINHIATSDVLCIPSIWLENSPGVVIQALGVGVPVIGSNFGGIPELVEHDETGLLLPPGDVQAWRDGLEKVLSDRDTLRRYQANAVGRAGEFDQDYLGAKYLKFIDEIRNFRGHASQ